MSIPAVKYMIWTLASRAQYTIEAVDILEAVGRVKKKNPSHKGYLNRPAM
jgi:hypothetical protein